MLNENKDISVNPQAARFLEMIKTSKKGKFKVYIGMAAGVGKTYRMLLEAKVLLTEGVDICIGVLETHGRIDTQNAAEGIPVIPKRKVFYKGKLLEEMDIDVIIKRKPEIVLVDELAHTNIPGSRNKKRWEDVVELINYGINVISTLNIQHIESVNKEVEKITGITVNERVPDSILHSADEVVNVDLTIEELIERIKQGKIYSQSKSVSALSNFFKPEVLLQLRELSLKEVTRQVGRQIEQNPINSEKRKINAIVTCISTNHSSALRLIRKSSRLVSIYNSKWYVINIQPSNSIKKIDSTTQRHLINSFKLAIELNADVIKIKNDNPAKSIVDFAKTKNAGIIVLGKPEFSISERLFGKKIISQVLELTNKLDIDILLVSSDE